MAYNKSLFLIPISFNDYEFSSKRIKNYANWVTDTTCFKTQYLFDYTYLISQNPNRFKAFKYNNPKSLGLYMFENYPNLELSNQPQLTDVSLWLFGTGIGFLGVQIDYNDCNIRDILEFSYRFKKAANYRKDFTLPIGKSFLFDVARRILPEEAELFFPYTDSIKFECRCFHMLQVPNEDKHIENMQKYCKQLRRTYNSRFDIEGTSLEEKYDMYFEPTKNDMWGGSQEGLVNICVESDDVHNFVNTFKEKQLLTDHLFMYLILLNQRYSCIKYIKDLSQIDSNNTHETDKLHEKIIKLKTAYSFRIISDDKVYQNIYSKMFDILDIEPLIADLEDIENQHTAQHEKERMDKEEKQNVLILGLTLLTVFSALIDAASYLERIPYIAGTLATAISATIVLVAGICCFLTWHNRHSNHKR